MRREKKVIILNKVDSPAISQAIFILRDNITGEFSAVDEAERVVREYMASARFRKRCPKMPFLLLAISLIIAGICIAFFTGL